MQYGTSAWCLTRELIGQELGRLYDAPTELPPRLRALARQLSTLKVSALTEESPGLLHALLQKLDVLEGGRLFRQCNQRLRDLPELDVRVLTTSSDAAAKRRFLSFIRNRADFNDEMTRLMGDAFDAARASLDGQAEPELFYEIIAARIVEAAMKGERDLAGLRDAGLAGFGFNVTAQW